MTDKEAEDFYNELVEYFGNDLPNFEHEPKRFAHCVKIYRYYKERKWG